jgi:iron(III) transport system substrate-binding protein
MISKSIFLPISLLCFLIFFAPIKGYGKEVVVYTSVDQLFSEPILRDFELETGINVKAVYDVEASKTTGLVNRLLAEKRRPKCDVFWNSEIGRTIVLKQKGIFTPYRSASAEDIPPSFKDKADYWTGFAARARVLIYNTNLLKKQQIPKSIFDLTGVTWRGKVALAYPLFGTTATHIAALYVRLGEKKTWDYLKALKANDVVVVDGNAVTRDLVVEGALPIAFTDTDDANVAIQAGKPVRMIYPDQNNGFGTLLIPNTVALIKDSPNPAAGKRLIDYLLSKKVESKLSYGDSAQMPLRDDVSRPMHVPAFSSLRSMKVDFYQVAQQMDKTARFCQRLFIR